MRGGCGAGRRQHQDKSMRAGRQSRRPDPSQAESCACGQGPIWWSEQALGADRSLTADEGDAAGHVDAAHLPFRAGRVGRARGHCAAGALGARVCLGRCGDCAAGYLARLQPPSSRTCAAVRLCANSRAMCSPRPQGFWAAAAPCGCGARPSLPTDLRMVDAGGGVRVGHLAWRTGLTLARAGLWGHLAWRARPTGRSRVAWGADYGGQAVWGGGRGVWVGRARLRERLSWQGAWQRAR